MKLSRQVGTVSQILNVYAQDFSVTTGAGIPNIPATTVSYTWFRNNHAGASTGVGVSTGTMGVFTSGAWTQINSATALGWYQFGIPNDALLSGDCSALLLRVSTGAFNIAPIPIEIELTKENNQQYSSSQTIGFVLNGVNMTSIVGSAAVTSGAGILNVSTQTLATPLTSTQIIQGVWNEINSSYSGVSTFGYVLKQVTSISAGATSVSIASGGLNFASVSSDAWPLWGVIDAGTVGNINTTSFTGSTAVLRTASSSYADDVLAGASLFIYNVSTGAGQRRLVVDNVSTNAIVQVDQWLTTPTQSTAKYVLFATPPASSSNVPDVNVAKILGTTSPATPGYVAIDWAQITNTSAAQVFSNTRFSTQSVTVGGVNVTAFAGSAIATSGAGILTVSTQTLATTTNANLMQIYGSAAVTSASGQLRVSTQTLPTFFGVDWGNVTNKAAYNDLSSTFISTNQSIAGASAPTAAQVAQAVWGEINSSYANISTFGYLTKQITSIVASGAVNVTSIAGSPVVTTAAGVILVSTQSLAGIVVSTQTIPAFATSSDSRFANLDVSVSSRAPVNVLTSTQAEGFRADGSPGSLVQVAYEILANLTEFSNSGTTRTLGSVTSGALGVATYQYNSTTPSAITRIS